MFDHRIYFQNQNKHGLQMAVANVQLTAPNYLKTGSKTTLAPIPVVNNVIANENVLFTYQSRDRLVLPQIQQEVSLLMKALKILTDKHYNGLVQRHYKTIKKIPKFYQNGIQLNELVLLLELIERCYHLLHIDSKYEECIVYLLQTISRPFLKKKMSEEVAFLDKTAIFWTKVGTIVEKGTPNIKTAFAKYLYNLINFSFAKENQLDNDVANAKATSRAFINDTIEKSRTCKSLAQCYQTVELLEDKLSILKCIAQISRNRLQAADVLQTEIINHILLDIKHNMEDYGFLFMSVETLWNLLEYGPTDLLVNKFDCLECLSSLHQVFVYQSKNCNSQAHRQLRNDILTILVKVASVCPNAPFVETGITKTIALYTGMNISSKGEISNKKCQQPYEDFELKKILFTMVIALSKNESSIRVFSHQELMISLFSYVQVIREPVNIMWTLAGFEELQLYAMAVLATLSPLCIDDYIECQGNTRLLLILDWCISTDDFVGHGNGFHGTGGRGSKRAQMRHCIRLLQSVCSLDDQRVLQDLTDQGAISQLVAILASCSTSTDPNDDVDIELQCDMMYILSTMCQGNIQRKEIFGEAGVEMIVQYLNGYVHEKGGPLYHHKLVLSAVDLFWSAVYGCFLNEMSFLEKEGAFLLIDLLEICDDSLQNFVLGALLDLMENKNTLHHIKLWQGKEGKSIGKLLVNMWHEEEKKLGVLRDESGVISDPTKPLITTQQNSEELMPLSTFLPTPAVVDVADNLRAKIYGIFLNLGFESPSGLTPADYITFAVIERYLDFKTMEIWQEISKELELEAIEPVESDKEIMEKILLIFHQKAEKVADLQKALIENNKDMEILEEQRFYEKIREKHRQEEKRFEDIINYIARTSNINTLKNERQKQLHSIDHSRQLSRSRTITLEKEAILHDMVDRSLLTTVFCGRNVTVQSTIYPSDLTMEEIYD